MEVSEFVAMIAQSRIVTLSPYEIALKELSGDLRRCFDRYEEACKLAKSRRDGDGPHRLFKGIDLEPGMRKTLAASPGMIALSKELEYSDDLAKAQETLTRDLAQVCKGRPAIEHEFQNFKREIGWNDRTKSFGPPRPPLPRTQQ